VIALVALTATQASAYPDRGSGSKCGSGTSGTACAHVETDIGSGHIRARMALDAKAGKIIASDHQEGVDLWELTTERSTGEQSAIVVADNDAPVSSTGSVVSLVAGPVKEQCDTKLATFQWRAGILYTTNTGMYEMLTPWFAGAC
jgi:hypothetical protein